MNTEHLYSILLKTEFILSVPVFLVLFFIHAPYGKFVQKKWGPALNAPLGWLLMEMPSVILPLFFFISSDLPKTLISWSFIIIWELHYLQRTFLYPAILNRKSHQMPIAVILFSLIFNFMNGFINGYGIFILGDFRTSGFSPGYIIGIMIFLAGFILNLSSDHILRNLRDPGESGYKIPQRGLFKFICNPNYLGEILEWTGWAILTCSPAGAAFMLFTIANLLPRALANLKWYRKEFPEYPSNRRALIPFIL